MKLTNKEFNLSLLEDQFEKIITLFCNSNNIIGHIEYKELVKLQQQKFLIAKGIVHLGCEKIEFERYIKKLKLTYLFVNELSLTNTLIQILSDIKDPNDLLYGVDKRVANHVALELLQDDFFWSCTNELAPFGSDEGDLALEDYRNWKKNYPQEKMIHWIRSIINEIGEFKFDDYLNESILDIETIKQHELDNEFDTYYNYFVLDTCLIASGFGQLIDEGKIDKEVIPIIETSIKKLILWNKAVEWNGDQHIRYLEIMKDVIYKLKKRNRL